MADAPIPFHRPWLAGTEAACMQDALARGPLSGNGYYTRQCQQLIEDLLGVQRVLLTTSCTHALELAALLLDIQPGDEVIVPSFTFVSTASAFVLRGARPVFADIRPDTFNLDEAQLEECITERTRAIVPVHYGGIGCDMDAITRIATDHNLPIIEDAAQALFARYRSQPLGTFGCLGTLSFHDTKNLSCGEGGALLINDPDLVERAEIMREKGTNRSRFLSGQVDKYTWVDVGSSWYPAETVAACLWAQLEARRQIQSRRQRITRRYHESLQTWAATERIRLPVVPDLCESNHHLFPLLMSSPASRQALMDHLRQRGIGSAFHFLPLHLSPFGSRYASPPCPRAEFVSERLLRLPFHTSLTEEEQERVVQAVCEFRTGCLVAAA